MEQKLWFSRKVRARGIACLIFVMALCAFASETSAKNNMRVARMTDTQVEKLWRNMRPVHLEPPVMTAQVTTPSGEKENEVLAPQKEEKKKAYELHGEERFGGYYNQISGNKENAQMDEGPQFLQELDLTLLHHGKTGREFEMVFNSRLTDDKYVDTEHASIVDFHINISNQGYLFTLGDYLGTLSDFTFNQALRGVYLEKEFPELRGLKIIALAGIQNDRWEAFWKHLDNQSYDRYYEGIRVSFVPTGPLTVGFNFINGKDDPGSVSNSTAPSVENRVGSVDFSLTLLDSALNLNGEAAWSWFKATSEGGGELEEVVNERLKSVTDGAYRLGGDFTKGMFTVHAGYSRVEPKFQSIGGISSPDTEEYFATLGMTPWPQISLELGYRGARNNLDGQLETTTRHRMPELSITFQEIPHLDNLTVGFRFSRSSTDTGNDSVDTDTDTAGMTVDYSIFGFNISAEGEIRDDTDHVDAVNNVKTHSFGFRLDRTFTKGDFQFNPYIGFEWERQRGKTTTGNQASINVEGVEQVEVTREDIVVRVLETLRYTRTYTAGCQMNVGKDVDGEVSYSYIDEDVNAAGGGNDSKTTTLDVNFTYRILGHEDKLLGVYYKLEDHNYELGNDDYKEQIYGFQLTKRF